MAPTHAVPAPPTSTDSGPLLVVVAMREEAEPIRARLTAPGDPAEGDPQEIETPFAQVQAVRGELAGAPTVLLTTGIGIAAASAAATWGILAHRPRAVIAAGSCGGLASDIEVGTLVVGETFAYSIADATAFGYAPGQVPGQPERFTADVDWADRAEAAARAASDSATDTAGLPSVGPHVRRGLMLSGDAFVTAPLAQPMRERFPQALTADMETTATAQIAAGLGVPMVALRAVSDLCGPAAGQQFHLELDVVAERSAQAVEELARGL